ncbi:MAG: glycosyltransferase [Candidatus Margulisiibacteriota bacterium]
MKIAFFTEAYKPYQSGVTISIDTFARDLVRLGHDVRVYAPAYPEHAEAEINPSSFRFFSIALGYPGFRLAVPVSARMSVDIKKFNPDIIHAHHPYQLGWLARFWAKKLGIPLFYTFHTLFTEYVHNVPLLNKAYLTRRVITSVSNYCRSCACVIVPTEKALHILTDKYHVKNRAEIIPTGIDLKRFPKQPVRTVPDRKRLVHVGRVSQEKNIEFLLAVMRQLPEEISLLIVGGGPAEGQLQKQAAELDISDRVEFAGFQPRENLNQYFEQCDIFVTASKSETQGLVFMEAKAAALPTVAIRAAGAINMVKDGEDGFLVSDSVAEFANRVLAIYGDGGLYNKLSAGALQHIDDFSSMKMAERLVAVYESAIHAIAP